MQQVKLSPLNFLNFIEVARSGNLFEPKPKERKEAIRVTRWECPECGDCHDRRIDAEDCCVVHDSPGEVVAVCKCPVCDEEAYDQRAASNCCLWKDIDALTRWAMADAVEAGSTWAEQLQIDVK